MFADTNAADDRMRTKNLGESDDSNTAAVEREEKRKMDIVVGGIGHCQGYYEIFRSARGPEGNGFVCNARSLAWQPRVRGIQDLCASFYEYDPAQSARGKFRSCDGSLSAKLTRFQAALVRLCDLGTRKGALYSRKFRQRCLRRKIVIGGV